LIVASLLSLLSPLAFLPLTPILFSSMVSANGDMVMVVVAMILVVASVNDRYLRFGNSLGPARSAGAGKNGKVGRSIMDGDVGEKGVWCFNSVRRE
jgi:hypothetical protein